MSGVRGKLFEELRLADPEAFEWALNNLGDKKPEECVLFREHLCVRLSADEVAQWSASGATTYIDDLVWRCPFVDDYDPSCRTSDMLAAMGVPLAVPSGGRFAFIPGFDL